MSTILCKISSYHLNTQAGSAQRLELQLPSSRAVYSCVRIATISRTEGGQPQALVRSSDAHSRSRQPCGTMPVLRRRAPNLNYAPHGLQHPARRSDWRTPPNVLGVSGGQYRSLLPRLRRPLDAIVRRHHGWRPAHSRSSNRYPPKDSLPPNAPKSRRRERTSTACPPAMPQRKRQSAGSPGGTR